MATLFEPKKNRVQKSGCHVVGVAHDWYWGILSMLGAWNTFYIISGAYLRHSNKFLGFLDFLRLVDWNLSCVLASESKLTIGTYKFQVIICQSAHFIAYKVHISCIIDTILMDRKLDRKSNATLYIGLSTCVLRLWSDEKSPIFIHNSKNTCWIISKLGMYMQIDRFFILVNSLVLNTCCTIKKWTFYKEIHDRVNCGHTFRETVSCRDTMCISTYSLDSAVCNAPGDLSSAYARLELQREM